MTVRDRLPLVSFRVRWRLVGSHVHCRVFMRHRPGTTFVNVGSLKFAEWEWSAVREVLAPVVEILHDAEEA